MREILIGNHMPSSKAEMAAYSDELEAVAAGYEAAKTEYIEGQCSGAHAAAIWGTGDTAVADCVAFSVCQDWDQTDDVNDCTALSNFPECEPGPRHLSLPHRTSPISHPRSLSLAITPSRSCAPEIHAARARCDLPRDGEPPTCSPSRNQGVRVLRVMRRRQDPAWLRML